MFNQNEKKLFARSVVSRLMEHENQFVDRQIDNLIGRNNELFGETRDGFLYQGKFYYRGEAKGKQRKGIHLDLCEEMSEHLMAKATLGFDRVFLEQTLTNWYGAAKTYQDMRDITPEMLIERFPHIFTGPQTERKKPETDFPHYAGGQKARDKILLYLTTSMML